LFVALLRKAGIEAYPALVGTQNPKLFKADFPNPRQFDHCIVYLPTIKGGTWVDCTVKQFRLGEVPGSVKGRFALVTGGPDKLIQIPEDVADTSVTRLTLNASLAENELDVTGSLELASDDSDVLMSKDPIVVKSEIQSRVIDSLAPIQDLKLIRQSGRTFQISYKTPVQSVQPYQQFFLNILNYASLDLVNQQAAPGKVLSLGDPSHKMLEATIDLGSKHYPFDQIDKQKKGNHLNYSVKLYEKAGKLHYSADVFFKNGLLEEAEMGDYQKEMNSFRSDFIANVYVK
jgi:hypothetical protein